MKVQRFYIDKYDWVVTAYYAVTRYYVDEILDNLEDIGCDGKFLLDAEKNLRTNKLNTGLTFSNSRGRKSVMVIALTTSAKEFHRSLIHEIRHLQSHIASAYKIDEKSEEVCYLMDDIIDIVHDKVAHLLCNCCRKEE